MGHALQNEKKLEKTLKYNFNKRLSKKYETVLAVTPENAECST